MSKRKPYQTVFRAKGILDGCTSIEEMIQALDHVAVTLQDWVENGAKLAVNPIQDDYAYVMLKDITEKQAEEIFGKGNFFEVPGEDR